MSGRNLQRAAVVGLCCLVMAIPVVASGAAPVPAAGTMGTGPTLDRTQREVGANTIVELTRQVGVQGTISIAGALGTERRMFHPSGGVTWTLSFTDTPFFIDAAGCPSASSLTLKFVGHVKPGETTLYGHFGFANVSYTGTIDCQTN